MITITNDEKLVEVIRMLNIECKSGDCDGHFRTWEFALFYHKLGIKFVTFLQTVLYRVRIAKSNNQRLDLKWWENNYEDLKAEHGLPPMLFTACKADSEFCDKYKNSV